MTPIKFYLCRVKTDAPLDGEPTAAPVLSAHGWVWASSKEQAERITLRTRTPAIPIPKGRPPVNTALQLIDESTLERIAPSFVETVTA